MRKVVGAGSYGKVYPVRLDDSFVWFRVNALLVFKPKPDRIPLILMIL